MNTELEIRNKFFRIKHTFESLTGTNISITSESNIATTRVRTVNVGTRGVVGTNMSSIITFVNIFRNTNFNVNQVYFEQLFFPLQHSFTSTHELQCSERQIKSGPDKLHVICVKKSI